jgi:hypothetical protein
MPPALISRRRSWLHPRSHSAETESRLGEEAGAAVRHRQRVTPDHVEARSAVENALREADESRRPAAATRRSGPALEPGAGGGAALGSLLESFPVALWGAALVLLLRLRSA